MIRWALYVPYAMKHTHPVQVRHKASEAKFSMQNGGEIRIKAEAGDAEAQYQLGEMIWNDTECESQYDHAFSWYKRAANQGHAQAQAATGRCYFWGAGIGQDYGKGLVWLKKAERQLDSTYARYFLALAYLNARGCKRDMGKGLALLKKDAFQGCSIAMEKLSFLYRYGDKGVKQDLQEAYVWAELAIRCHEGGISLERCLEKRNEIRLSFSA